LGDRRTDYITDGKIIKQYLNDIESKYSVSLPKRLFSFAIKVFGLIKTIGREKEYDVFRYQLSKSATSIGANYEEAQGAYSVKEFASKIGICLKEARETNYFLRLIFELGIAEKNECEYLINESEEIKKIIATILIKTRNKL
jgi:four helix bundle protein